MCVILSTFHLRAGLLSSSPHEESETWTYYVWLCYERYVMTGFLLFRKIIYPLRLPKFIIFIFLFDFSFTSIVFDC